MGIDRMVDQFMNKWGTHLFNWFSFVFTVGAGAVGLLVAGQHWWVSLLAVVAVALASSGFALRCHREMKIARQSNAETVEQLTTELHLAYGRIKECEDKLVEWPLAAIGDLRALISAYSLKNVLHSLKAHADFVKRMERFSAAGGTSASVRRFTKQGGDLFAVAKAKPAALSEIRTGDPFLLVRKSAAGVDVPCAHLMVHQPPDQQKETVVFRIARTLEPIRLPLRSAGQ